MSTYKGIAGIVVLTLVLQGCGTIASLSDYRPGSDDPLVFGGTQKMLQFMSGEAGGEGAGKAKLAMGLFPPLLLIPLIDGILSFAADTVLLPVTVPWAISNASSNATIGERFDKVIEQMAEKCASYKLRPGQTCGEEAKLRPADPLATEEGRFAHSIQVPNPVPEDSGYRPGMSSEEYFDHLCKTEAGEFIFRLTDNVPGIYQMRPRTKSYYEGGHLYAPEDPYGLLLADYDSPGSFGGKSGYSFVEAPGSAVKTIEPVVPRSGKNGSPVSGADAKYIRYDFGFERGYWRTKETIYETALQSRYGYTWRGIKRPHDRELGIAGSEVIVLDLQTREVLAVFRGYAKFEFTRFNYGGTGMAWGRRCPVPVRIDTRPQRDFVFKVLKPSSLPNPVPK